MRIVNGTHRYAVIRRRKLLRRISCMLVKIRGNYGQKYEKYGAQTHLLP
jgi:hypothetical protein